MGKMMHLPVGSKRLRQSKSFFVTRRRQYYIEVASFHLIGCATVGFNSIYRLRSFKWRDYFHYTFATLQFSLKHLFCSVFIPPSAPYHWWRRRRIFERKETSPRLATSSSTTPHLLDGLFLKSNALCLSSEIIFLFVFNFSRKRYHFNSLFSF